MSAFDDVLEIAPTRIWDGGAARVVNGERITMAVVELDPREHPARRRGGPGGAVVIDVFSPVRGDWQALERESPRPPRWPA